ncbi:hypothetical protein EUX98_g3940 [Antrodiella citrinella]|uniref:BTB domain-containing protein n=1 Tax=Antrodiella citrinella TaxID=2447956 RepID=A0A4S4MWC3_9APHY|nr:hypothetical protein EUX98_g3940 [Antrodiella citrinella]
MSQTLAQAPFDGSNLKADIVLRTSDDVHFCSHKIILYFASSFFEQMFTLPPPESPPSPSAQDPDLADVLVTSDGVHLHIIPVSEDSQTIDHLLRLLYPIHEPPRLTELSVVDKCLEAAMKYEMDKATALLKASLTSLVHSSPLEVYSIACRLHLEVEAKLAAQTWRASVTNDQTVYMSPYDACTSATAHSVQEGSVTPCADKDCKHRNFKETAFGSSFVTEMRSITSGSLHRLLRYLRTGVETSFCSPTSGLEADSSPSPSLTPTSNSSCPSYPKPLELESFPADIALRSLDGALIYTHKILLAFASASCLLEKARDPKCPILKGIPVIDVDENQTTLEDLVQTFQPHAVHLNFTLNQACRVWVAAKKYGMTRAMDAARLSCREKLEEAPLPVYFTAVSHGWFDEARQAAQSIKRKPPSFLDSYVAEMEGVSAGALYRLHWYLHDYRKAVCDVYVLHNQLPLAAQRVFSVAGDVDAHLGHGDVPVIAGSILRRDWNRINGSPTWYYDGSGRHATAVVDMETLVNESLTVSHKVKDAVLNVCLKTDEDHVLA